MPIDTRDVIELVCKLSEHNDLKVTEIATLKGLAALGCGVVLGGLLLGPIGVAIGFIVSGMVMVAVGAIESKLVAGVIRRMDHHVQRELAELVGKIIHNEDTTDAMNVNTIVSGNPAMQREILYTVVKFLRKFGWKFIPRTLTSPAIKNK